ncbi:Protein of unknown function [Evansella caseinilytica]|uniref:Uncharacterized protein n=1 Tax=Evansella caseinilytica TaxID=1503961 RepID=A0A1H3P0E7_9BACI|nr:DUF3918 family protein [Evansella caseinilytica]SDY94587.1 Protein of unknown function [Evansella caseinilytica]
MNNFFGLRRRNNNARNGIMMSLVGIGIGAAAYGMIRGRNNGNNNMMRPVKQWLGQNQQDDNYQ